MTELSDDELKSRLQQLTDERNRRAARYDRVAFARLVRLEPDPWQQAFLQSNTRRRLLNCSRQAGKSTVSAVLALHTAVYVRASLTLIISPSQRQSSELLRKVLDRINYLPVKPRTVGESKLTIELSNRSRIICLPANEATVRGFSAPSLIIEDEAGDVPDDLYQSFLPMLVTSKDAWLILAGTPKGRSGHFFEAWENGGPRWERTEVRYSDCPRISREEIDAQRVALQDKFLQEYECQFINASSGLVYGAYDSVRNDIASLPTTPPEHAPFAPWQYLLGLDFGFVDATAFVVIAYRAHDPNVYVVRSYKRTRLTPGQAAEHVQELDRELHFERIIGDCGGLGKGYAEEMRYRFRIAIVEAEKQNKRGYQDLINGDFATGRIKVLPQANQDLIAEIRNLPWNDDRSREHPRFDNHLCDALLYVWRACVAYFNTPAIAPRQLTPEERIRQDTDAFWQRQADYEKLRRQQEREESGSFGDVRDDDYFGLY